MVKRFETRERETWNAGACRHAGSAAGNVDAIRRARDVFPVPQLLVRTGSGCLRLDFHRERLGHRLVSAGSADWRTIEMPSACPKDIIGREMRDRRSIEQACADLRAKYQRRPTPQLLRMIEQLEAELKDRRQAP
jgi:hypothetical protein